MTVIRNWTQSLKSANQRRLLARQPLVSLEEDFKRDREQFRKDELDQALRRSSKLVTPEAETTYERLEE